MWWPTRTIVLPSYQAGPCSAHHRPCVCSTKNGSAPGRASHYLEWGLPRDSSRTGGGVNPALNLSCVPLPACLKAEVLWIHSFLDSA